MHPLIRAINQHTSCTITSTQGTDAIVEYAPFRDAKFSVSTIIVYEHEGNLYYPLALEYRLIDNNILYMIQEIGLTSFKEVFDALERSMMKEEKWTNEFKLTIVHLKNEPNFCYKLPSSFVIGSIPWDDINE